MYLFVVYQPRQRRQEGRRAEVLKTPLHAVRRDQRSTKELYTDPGEIVFLVASNPGADDPNHDDEEAHHPHSG